MSDAKTSDTSDGEVEMVMSSCRLGNVFPITSPNRLIIDVLENYEKLAIKDYNNSKTTIDIMPFWKKMFNKNQEIYYPCAIVLSKPVETETIARDLVKISTISNSDVQAIPDDIAGVMNI